jgi:CRISPR-associated protein (TIGR02584 family)
MARILIATLGKTPAVVTETVWALHRRPVPWTPDRIELITTRSALGGLCAGLLRPGGPFETIFATRDEVPPVRVLVPVHDLAAASVQSVAIDWRASDGAAAVPDALAAGIEDVADEATAACMGDLILERVHAVCATPGNALHLSISGGRKTMSAHALFSLGLVGNPQDVATHVMLDREFEGNPAFWHPDQGGTIPVLPPRGAPPAEPPRQIEAREAARSLRLFPIAAPRFDAVPKPDRAGKLPRLSVIIGQMNLAGEWLRAPALALDPATNTATVCGEARRLDAVDFVWLRLLASAAHENWTCDQDGADQPPGAVTAARLLAGAGAAGGPARLDRLRGWFAEAEAARDHGPARRRSRATGTEAKLRGWMADLATARKRQAPELLREDVLAVAENLVTELQTNISKLKTHVGAHFGLPLADAMLPGRTTRPRAVGEMPQAAYRLAGIAPGFLGPVG